MEYFQGQQDFTVALNYQTTNLQNYNKKKLLFLILVSLGELINNWGEPERAPH